MLLRRVTNHINQQNWFAVFIDFLIVVVGVFIGIQVSNWNGQRADRALEQEYLERIYFDAVRSINSSVQDQDWSDERMQTQAIVLTSIRKGELLEKNQDAFARGLAFFGYVQQANRNWQAVKELQSTGRMTVIQDVGLRELIGITELEVMNRERHEAGVRKMRREFFVNLSAHWEFFDSDFTPGGKTNIKYDFQALVDDPEILNQLSQMNMLSTLLIRNKLRDAEAYSVLKEAVVTTLGYEPKNPQSSLTNTAPKWGAE